MAETITGAMLEAGWVPPQASQILHERILALEKALRPFADQARHLREWQGGPPMPSQAFRNEIMEAERVLADTEHQGKCKGRGSCTCGADDVALVLSEMRKSELDVPAAEAVELKTVTFTNQIKEQP